MRLRQRPAGRRPVGLQVLRAGQVRQEARALDEGADRAEHVGARRAPAGRHPHLAGVGPDQPDEHPHRRRLARAVRARAGRRPGPARRGSDTPSTARKPSRVRLDQPLDDQRDVGAARAGGSAARRRSAEQHRDGDRGQHQRGRRPTTSGSGTSSRLAPSGVALELRAAPAPAPASADPVDGRRGGLAYAWSVVETTSLQPVPDRDLVRHGRQRDLDRAGGPGSARSPGPAPRPAGAARADGRSARCRRIRAVPDRRYGLVAGRRPAPGPTPRRTGSRSVAEELTASCDPPAADQVQRRGQRRAGEGGGLAGQHGQRVAGRRRPPAERAAVPGRLVSAPGRPPGGATTVCAPAGRAAAAGWTRARRRDRPGSRPRVSTRGCGSSSAAGRPARSAGTRHREAGVGGRCVALQVAVEPASITGQQRVDGSIPPSWPAGDPGHRGRGGRRQAAQVGVGLVEPEQGVVLALARSASAR